MTAFIEMPRLSEGVEEGVLVAWFVEPGAIVRAGDLVAEVQVEKMAAEVRAPADGRVRRLLVAAGDIVRQGGPIVELEATEPAERAGAPEPFGATEGDVATEAAVATAAASSSAGGVPVAGAGAALAAPPGTVSEAVVASPAARRLARELGVDLAGIGGSGPGGRVVEEDVRAAAGGVARRPRLPALPTLPRSGPRAPRPAVRFRQAHRPATRGRAPGSSLSPPCGGRSQSAFAPASRSTAQLTLTAEADVTALAGSLAGLPVRDGRRPGYTEAIVRACAIGLRDHPRLAARWTPDGFVHPERIDIGVAVAIDDGLLVPVVREPERRDLATLAAEIAVLADRARAGSLAPGETEGGCFTVTNLGRYRVDVFTPLLNPPQTAILGVGRARPRPAVVAGAVAVRTLVALSLTIDHQAIDGAPAAAFLDAVVGLLEDPERLVQQPE